MNALVFLYRHVLKQSFDQEINAVQATRKINIPVVMTREVKMAKVLGVTEEQPILPNLLCCQAVEVRKYVCVPSASHLWQTWLLYNLGSNRESAEEVMMARRSVQEVKDIKVKH